MSIASSSRDPFTETIGISTEPFITSVDISGNEISFITNNNGNSSSVSAILDQSVLDKYIVYDSETDRVVTNKAFQTTLSSVYLKNQHSVSSGYQNVFFKNLTSNVAWFPTWQGLKIPQTLAENRGDDGIYKPTARIYTTDVQEVERFGDVISTGEVLFDEYSFFENKNSVYGLDFILAEIIDTSVQMKFLVTKEDRDVYEQLLPVQNYSIDQQIRINFSIPLESLGNEYISIQLCKVDLETLEDTGFVNVRPATNTDDLGQIKVYAKLYLRLFEDKEIALKDDIVNIDVSGNTIDQSALDRITELESSLLNSNNGNLINVESRFQAQRQLINDLEIKIQTLENQITSIFDTFSSN